MMYALMVSMLSFFTPAYGSDIVGQAKIIDGDSLEIQGQSIRLHGIDAVEKDQRCCKPEGQWSCGLEAKEALEAFINDRDVSCTLKDIDKHDRLVSVCYVAGQSLNAWMIQNGWAIAYRRYLRSPEKENYIDYETGAKQAKRGLWQGHFTLPETWRHRISDSEKQNFTCQPKYDGVEIVGQAKVIDGDTLKIQGQSIQLHGIDAAEKDQRCCKPEGQWSCGLEAGEALESFIDGRDVSCTLKKERIDRYNRLIAVCYVAGQSLNAWMIQNGWAIAYRSYLSPPERQNYIDYETRAKQAKRGLWQGHFSSPETWRHRISDSEKQNFTCPPQQTTLFTYIGIVLSLLLLFIIGFLIYVKFSNKKS